MHVWAEAGSNSHNSGSPLQPFLSTYAEYYAECFVPLSFLHCSSYSDQPYFTDEETAIFSSKDDTDLLGLLSQQSLGTKSRFATKQNKGTQFLVKPLLLSYDGSHCTCMVGYASEH